MKIACVRQSLAILGLIAGVGLIAPVFAEDSQALDYKYYFDLYGIEVENNAGVDIQFPTWAKPNPDQDITDLSYRVNDVLPFAEDRNAPKYIVYPKHGIVVPVVLPNASDKALIDRGEMFNHFPYLQVGALHYFGFDPQQGYGNMVIAWHSSYNKSDPGRYKTTFQALPISRAGDKVFVYIKNKSGTYDFFQYKITKSFRTDKYNVGIMQHTPDEFTLTTYGCYPIGSNEERWVNVATLTSKKLAQSDLKVERVHTSADEEAPSLVGEKITATKVPVVATNVITKQILARAISHAYDSAKESLPKEARLTISDLITARATYQARDAQTVVTDTNTVAVTEHESAEQQPTTIVQSAKDIIAELLRPKMSLQQEIIINARAKHVITSSSPDQIEEFIKKLQTKKSTLAGSTDKVSLWKDVIISHLLEQLTNK